MPEVQAGDRRSVLGWVKHIGDLRDGLLVGASLLYGLGYFVWSLNAWVNNLGFLPLIESQYLVAGVAPALILWLAYCGLRPVAWFMDQLPSLIGPGVKGWRLVWRSVMLTGVSGSFVGLIASFTPWFQSRFPEWARSGPLAFGAILAITTVLFAGSGQKNDWVARLYAKAYTYFIPFGIASLALAFYIALHRTLPHEFGGSRPRCAYLDVTRAKMSDDSLRDLVPPDAMNAGRPVVRSKRLLVYFSGRDFVLVRPFVEPRGTYEVGRGVIEAVNWCGRETDGHGHAT